MSGLTLVYFHPLNFIRFILAVGVVLFHYGISYYPFNDGILKTLIVNSSFRVSFFFFISGFVMCMVYAKQAPELTARQFYKKRFTRIFPLYWLAFALTLLAVLFIKGAAPKGLNILLHALGQQSLNPGYVLDLNYPTWSVSVELVFYLLFPFLVKWMLSLSQRTLFVVTALSWILQSLQHILFVNYVYSGTKASEEFISTFPLWHLPTFFTGMVTAHVIALNKEETGFTKHATWCLLISLLLLMCIVVVPNPVVKYIHNGLLSPLFMVIILGLYYDRSILHKVLSNRHLSKLGELSYGLFIFQYPLWLVFTKLAGTQLTSSTWFFIAYFACLLAVAKVVNVYFEKPLLRRLRKAEPGPAIAFEEQDLSLAPSDQKQ